MLRRWASGLGTLVSVAGGAFVAVLLVRRRAEVASTVAEADPVALAAALFSTAVGMVVVAGGWSRAARSVGLHLPPRVGVPLFFRGEVGKYVPGAVWAVVGRGELARRATGDGPRAYGSVLVSLAAFYVAAAGLGGPLLVATGAEAAGVLTVAAGVVAVAACDPRLVGGLRRLAVRAVPDVRVPEVPTPSALLRVAAGYLPAWPLLGGATWLAARALGVDVGVARAIGATAAAWLAGFVVVPAPGGLGVREAVLVALLGPAAGPAAGVAVAARLLCVVVDGAGAVLASVRRRTPDAATPASSEVPTDR